MTERDLATNRIAKRDYEILETFEAGFVLFGQEVKSIRGGQMKLQGSYVTIAKGNAWLVGSHVPPYKPAGQIPVYDPDRSRKLLLHKRELATMAGHLHEKGLTLVPIRVYTRHGKIKLEIGLGRGRKEYEKREVIKKRDIDREIRADLKQNPY